VEKVYARVGVHVIRIIWEAESYILLEEPFQIRIEAYTSKRAHNEARHFHITGRMLATRSIMQKETESRLIDLIMTR